MYYISSWVFLVKKSTDLNFHEKLHTHMAMMVNGYCSLETMMTTTIIIILLVGNSQYIKTPQLSHNLHDVTTGHLDKLLLEFVHTRI